MKVYLDLYFLINYILDISILLGVSKLLKYSIKFYKYLLGGLVGSISLLVLFVNNSL
ncbi:MAG: sigma-E processing peptidase SpoIIGA, partial [Bacilli bacterium]|nr:sigma-E processing peptidase SpoIIGA [Bacilli bacterium]